MYAFYYFYIVVFSVSVCQRKKNVQIIKRKYTLYNDKYRHTRDRLFGLDSIHASTCNPNVITNKLSCNIKNNHYI